MRIFTILVLAVAWTFGSAQSTSPQVIGSVGAHFANGTGQLSQTVGETVITTETDGNNILTQGFHQTKLQVISLNEDFAGIAVNVFPNPVSDLLKIETEGLETTTNARLFSANGKLLAELEAEMTGSVELNMQPFADGSYQLIFIQNGQAVKSFSIIKNQ